MLLIFNSSIFTMGVRTMFEQKEERKGIEEKEKREYIVFYGFRVHLVGKTSHVTSGWMDRNAQSNYTAPSPFLSLSHRMMPPCVSNLHNPESTCDALPQGIQVERLSVRIESLQCYRERRHDNWKFYQIFSFASVNNFASFQRILKFNCEKCT